MNGSDDSLLNSYFADWGFADMRKHLPQWFNCPISSLTMAYTYLPALVENIAHIRIVRFTGRCKPWHFQYDSPTDDITLHGCRDITGYARLCVRIFVTDVHASLRFAVDKATRHLAPVDEVVHRLAFTAIPGNSQLRLSYFSSDGMHSVLRAEWSIPDKRIPTILRWHGMQTVSVHQVLPLMVKNRIHNACIREVLMWRYRAGGQSTSPYLRI